MNLRITSALKTNVASEQKYSCHEECHDNQPSSHLVYSRTFSQINVQPTVAWRAQMWETFQFDTSATRYNILNNAVFLNEAATLSLSRIE